MTGLTVITWGRFIGWLVLGLLIYYVYSRHRSEFAKKLLPHATSPTPQSGTDRGPADRPCELLTFPPDT
jgi:APA family basic amino acid/polyamine antiporter